MTTDIFSFSIKHYGISDKGPLRKRNEDFWLASPENGIYILTDGMGGLDNGDLAAQETGQTLIKLLRNTNLLQEQLISPQEVADVMRFTVQQVNSRVYQQGHASSNAGMGSTLCCLYIYAGKYAVNTHVGDSRIYRLRQGHLKAITNDDSLFAEKVKTGELKLEDRKKSKSKHILTKAIGVRSKVRATVSWDRIEEKDLYLLCSDGLTNALIDEEISSVLKTSTSPQEKAKTLVSLANLNNGEDNIAVLVLQVEKI